MRFLYQLSSTWLHFGSKNLPTSRLRGVLGRLGRVLERLGLILERPGGVLERLGRVLGRLGAENSVLRRPGSHARFHSVQMPSSAWPRLPPNNQDEERLPAERLPTEKQQTSTNRFPNDADTQLGAFGPGADPKRSRAAIPPPRLPS